MPQQQKMKHVVRRVTDPDSAAKALDQASSKGYSFIGVEGGGADGSVAWLMFAKPATRDPGTKPEPMRHAVRRVTDEAHATEALDKASANGFRLVASEGGGGANALWLFFARPADVEDAEEAPPPPPAPQKPAGGSFEDDDE